MVKRSDSDKTKRFQKPSLVLVVFLVAAIGTYLISSTHAATLYISANADTGTVANGATVQACSGASDGSCVIFGHSIALGFAVFLTESDSNGTPSTAFADYQTSVGKLPDFVEFYHSWPPAGNTFANYPLYWGSEAQQVQSDKLTPVVSWSTDAIPLTTIISGGDDASVLAPAAALAKTYPGTLYIRLDWEMNGAWSQWNPTNPAQPAGETPATYIAMWQHVVNYFRSAGVTNVKWVWAPNIDSTGVSFSEYYPGDSYVDYAALDGYNNAYIQNAAWATPQQVFGASYSALENVTKKPVMITETSSVEANTSEAAQGLSKALWIQQLSTYLPTLGNVVSLCWFNQPATVTGYGIEDYSVNTSAASLAAWDQYFVNNPEYQGKLP